MAVKFEHAEHDRIQFLVGQINRRPDDVIPDADRLQNSASRQDWLDERQDDRQHEPGIAAAVDARGLVQLFRNRLHIPRHQHKAKADASIDEHKAEPGIVQAEGMNQIPLGNEIVRQEDADHEKDIEKACPSHVAPRNGERRQRGNENRKADCRDGIEDAVADEVTEVPLFPGIRIIREQDMLYDPDRIHQEFELGLNGNIEQVQKRKQVQNDHNRHHGVAERSGYQVHFHYICTSLLRK